ncbi:DUF3046 domain-containing protein [Klugiella xanthotipulae]|uniref:DUF3046 domain-containing protein n=1 Tax=Klugiella xanthotipulae TaxID=244735 RepID=UPI0011520C1A|nr:DUF3046 domain-containing protein [Klugiella xanthotipulae]
MRLSEFRSAVSEEFGDSYGSTLIRDVLITELGSRSADLALSEGVSVDDVWHALCREMDVPPDRWHGRGRPER